jgi:hypothetical protein
MLVHHFDHFLGPWMPHKWEFTFWPPQKIGDAPEMTGFS